jgi:hypothetical protein
MRKARIKNHGDQTMTNPMNELLHLLEKMNDDDLDSVLIPAASALACSGRLTGEELVEDAIRTTTVMFLKHVSDNHGDAADYLRSYANKIDGATPKHHVH